MESHDNFLGSLIVSVIVGLLSYFKSRKSIKTTQAKIEDVVHSSEVSTKKSVEDIKSQITLVIENDCKKEITYLLDQFTNMQTLIVSHLTEDKFVKEDFLLLKQEVEQHSKWFKAFHSALMTQNDQIRDVYKILSKPK